MAVSMGRTGTGNEIHRRTNHVEDVGQSNNRSIHLPITLHLKSVLFVRIWLT
jgi:hypothetical protein